MAFEQWFQQTKNIMPVIVINDIAQAVPLAKALIAGGIHCLEITLRTPQGIEAIKTISEQVPEAIVGAGTITNSDQIRAVKDAGGKFIISPGISHDLCKTAQNLNMPYAPGIMTPSDILIGLDYGVSIFKFYPASLSGGVDMLKAFAGPFKNIKFCPTGGITEENSAQYLALDNVIAVGGSWVCPSDLIKEHKWSEIQSLAQAV
ncbi:MAG: bifunctional 4-hydroxy-2-oxoglutarate aldolase/2-dehydro-3-deoxy-phosphogluconate aldolase [Bermanella sp.]